MPAPLDPEQRAAIAAAIRAGGSRNAIARDHGVSGSTVGKIARDEGIDGAFDRSQTKEASVARTVDAKAWRGETASRLSKLASVVIGSLEEMTPEQWAKAPPYFRMLIVAIAVDKIETLTQDDGQGLAAVDSWLADVIEGGS